MFIREKMRQLRKIVIYNMPKYRFDGFAEKNKRIILMGEPEYGNLGDHAIAYATKKYIENNCAEYNFESIEEKYILYSFERVKKYITSKDILILQGGGNMGDLYLDQVQIRRKVITSFPNNKIILMPQTIHFSSPKKRLPQYYFEHSRLVLLAREKITYEILRELFIKERVFLTPDIVLSLTNEYVTLPTMKRSGGTICMRDDIESLGNVNNKIKNIIDELDKSGYEWNFMSTVINRDISVREREAVLETLFRKIEKSEIFITDRLHGMIIAAITKTPCVVLPTFNHKVISCYEWIKNLNYVELCPSIEKLGDCIKCVSAVNDDDKTELDLLNKFEIIKKIIEE